MSVRLETSLGDIEILLLTPECPNTTKNFLKLCKIKYYNNCLFHNVQKGFIVQTGDPTGTGKGGESVYGILYGEEARYFEDEIHLQLKHKAKGVVAMANTGKNLNGSQFYITTGENLDYLDGKHTIFGFVESGMDVVDKINDAFVDKEGRPLLNIRIKKAVILDDPFPDPPGLVIPDRSPELVKDVRPEADEKLDENEGKTEEEIQEDIARKDAESHSILLEMIEDLPRADIKPPENVLFVCKLHPVTQAEDLEIIFSRFGTIKSCEIIKDWKTGDSLGYAFIEFSDKKECEAAYLKMDNVLIDDRRIHVDFSQSVSKMPQGRNYQKAFEKFSLRNTKLKKNDLQLKSSRDEEKSEYSMVFENSEFTKSNSSERYQERDKERDKGRTQREKESKEREGREYNREKRKDRQDDKRRDDKRVRK